MIHCRPWDQCFRKTTYVFSHLVFYCFVFFPFFFSLMQLSASLRVSEKYISIFRYIIISETEIIDFDLLKGVSSYIEYIFNVYVCLRFELLAINMEKSRDSLSPLGSMFSQDDVRFQSFSVSLLRFFSFFLFSYISVFACHNACVSALFIHRI